MSPMSRRRIADLRRMYVEADMPDGARARQLEFLDQLEGEWVNEVYRRWTRRRYAPLTAASRAVDESVAEALAGISGLVRRLRR